MTREEFIKLFEPSVFTVEWTTGGKTGGHWDGSDATDPVEADDEPDFDVLDDILLDIMPNITLLQYRKLVKVPGLITRRTWEDREYYGNYYCKASKSLDLGVLYDCLQEIRTTGYVS